MDFRIVKCKCNQVIYSCTMPEAINDIDFIKKFKRYEKDGYKSEFIKRENYPENNKFGCKCDSRIKVAICKCGEIVAGSVMPSAETDRESIKMFRDLVKRGYKVDYMEGEVKLSLTGCKCKKQSSNKEESNQLSLF